MFNVILLIGLIALLLWAIWFYRVNIVNWIHERSYSLFKLFLILVAWTFLCLAWCSCTPKLTVAGGGIVMDSDGVLHICPEADTIQIYKKIRVVVNHEYCGHNKKGGFNE